MSFPPLGRVLVAGVLFAGMCRAAGGEPEKPSAETPPPAAETPPVKTPAGGPEADPGPAASPEPPPPEQKREGTGVSVEDCVLIALRNNVDLRRQRLGTRQAEMSRLSALAEFLPGLSASGTLSRESADGVDDTEGRTGSVGITGRTPWGTSISGSASQTRSETGGDVDASSTVSARVRQPLLSGGGTTSALYSYRAADRESRASREDLERQSQRTVYNVRKLYWAAVKNELVVQASRRALDSADYFLKAAEARYKAERASRLDISNAEIQRSNREVALTNAESGRESGLDDLKEAMDLLLEEKLYPLSPPDYRAARRDPAALLGRLMAGRPDLRAARQRLEVKRLDLQRKRRDAWPDLDLVAGYTLSGSGGSTDESHGYSDRDLSVGLELSVPLGLVRRRADLRKAELELRREELSVHSREVTAEKELRSVLRNLDAAERNLASYEKRVAAAKLAAAAAKALYERGKASSFEVIRAEDDLLDAELGLARSRADCLTLAAELELVTGQTVAELAGGGAGSGAPAGAAKEK